ncbi:MAG: extracellular solute-binding protein [Candidatus Gallimonas sp.]
MKKNALKFVAACASAVLLLAGCGEPPAASGNTLSLMLDSSAFLIGFDDIDVAIGEAEKAISDGTTKDTMQNRILIENTKLLRAWGEEQEKVIVTKNWGWGDSLTQKLMAAFLAQETPDVIQAETQMPGFAQEGYLEPFPDDLETYVRENVSPIAWKSMEYNGKIYGISLTPGQTLLYWNKEILRLASVSEDIIENGPSDWTEWEETMAAIHAVKDSSGTNLNAGGVYVGSGGVNYGAFFRCGTLMAAAGGGFADENGAPALASAANEQAFEFLLKQKDYNLSNILNRKEEGSYFSYFNTGKMAYKVDGIWGIHDAEEYGLDVGYCLMPTPDGTGERKSLLIGAVYSAVPVYARNKDAAFDAIRFMLGADVQENIAKGGLRQPVLKSVLNTVYDRTEEEWYRDYFADYKYYAQYAVENEIEGLPAFPMKKGKLSTLWGAAGNAFSLTADKSNTKTAAQLIAEAQKTMSTEWMKG